MSNAHQFLKMTSPMSSLLTSIVLILSVLSLYFADQDINNVTRYENSGFSTTRLIDDRDKPLVPIDDRTPSFRDT